MRGIGPAKFNAAVTAAVTLILLSMIFSTPANASVSGAQLSVTLTDQSGSGVPNATVSIKNTATGIARAVATNETGFYSVPNLTPGVYEVTFSAPGFSTQVLKGITLTVGAQQSLNSDLKVGQVSQRIEVTGEVPQGELTSSPITNQCDSNTMPELPLNGRDWASLPTLQPGVIRIHTQF